MEKDRSQNWHLYGCSPVCVLKCLVRFADLGNVLPQYLQPYLSLLGLPTPPPLAPPSMAFSDFCTGTSRLEIELAPSSGDEPGKAGLEYSDPGPGDPVRDSPAGTEGSLKLFSKRSYMARWLAGARLGEGGYLYGKRLRLSQTRE